MIARRKMAASACLLLWFATSADAQEEGAARAKVIDPHSAPRLVREGNKLLLDDKANLALEKYDLARTIAPDAREIAFAEGLSHFKLGDYTLARDRFSEVAGSAGDALADDALYSRGTCDHAEALASTEDAEQALGKLESAIRTYRDVLGRNPTHEAARDANFKATSMWRQLKQQMQQQEQQQEGDSDNENEEQEDQENQEQEQQQSDEDQQENQQQKSEDQQSEEQKPSESKQDEKQEQQQEPSKSDEQKEPEQQQQVQQSEQEQVSQEQAERKLRELLEELKDRQKARQKPVQGVPAPRGGKDW